MVRIWRRLLVLIPLAFAGCGDNDHGAGNPDASEPDAHVDAPLDAFVECNYTEQHDTTNDYLAVTGAIEDTGLTYTGTGTRTVCGTVNNGHFDNVTNFTVDIDNYLVTFSHDTDVLVTLIADGTHVTTTESLGVFAVSHTDTSNGFGVGNFNGDHGVFSGHFPAGTYEFSVEAYDNQDETVSLPYKMRITEDSPATRCARSTASPNYAEASDGASNVGNNVISIDYSAIPFAHLTAAADAPETSGLTFANQTKYLITGNSAANPQDGSYFDADTFQIDTGNTNQLAIRLNWPAAAADLDYYLFQENSTVSLGSSSETKLGEDEFATIAVSPNTRYWLWVGGFQDSTVLPAAYAATVCAETYP